MSIPRNLSIVADTLNSDGTFASISNTGSTTLSSGTANGVAYLNGSKVLTTGSALQFDGGANLSTGGSNAATYNNLNVNNTSSTGYSRLLFNIGSSGANGVGGVKYAPGIFFAIGTDSDASSTPMTFNLNGSEQMRLNSTGLGIGTSSPANKLVVSNAGAAGFEFDPTNGNMQTYNRSGAAYTATNILASSINFKTGTSPALSMLIDSSGNVGIGTNSPSFGLSVQKDNGSGYVALFRKSVSDVALTIQTTSSITQIQGLNAALSATNDIAMQLSGGNVGIGTSAPSTYAAKLVVTNTTTSTNFSLVNTSAVANTNTVSTDYYLPDNSTGLSKVATIGVDNTSATGNRYGNIYFSTSNVGAPAERMRIDSSGNLLVGTTSQTATPNTGVQLTNFSGSIGLISIGHASGTATGNYYASFAYAGGLIGSITQSGTTAVLFNVTSDQRLKENIQDAESASSLIDALQVRQFDWKTDNTHQRYGFVAQELVTVAPEAVHQPVNEEEMMAVDYSKLVPMLVKEIQSLRKRLADAGIA